MTQKQRLVAVKTLAPLTALIHKLQRLCNIDQNLKSGCSAQKYTHRYCHVRPREIQCYLLSQICIPRLYTSFLLQRLNRTELKLFKRMPTVF